MSQNTETVVDAELKDMLMQALDTTGQLASLRAQLRAGLYLALEGSGSKFPFTKSALASVPLSPAERAAITVVRNFLAKTNMLHTLSIFDAESGISPLADNENAAALLNVDSSSPSPALVQFLELNPPVSADEERPKTAHRKTLSRRALDAEDVSLNAFE